MADISGLSFNVCFYTLMSKLWLSGEIPEDITSNDVNAKLFMDKTIDAISFLSNVSAPEEYRSLYFKTYKDSNGSFLYIQLPDCKTNSDAITILIMNQNGIKKYYTVERFGSQTVMCEYTDTKKLTTGFMIDDFDDCLNLYLTLTGSTSSELIS